MAVTFQESFDQLVNGEVISTEPHLDIRFRAVATTFNNSTTAATTLTLPAGILAGDVMLLQMVSSDTVAGAAITVGPTGWTTLVAHTSQSSMSYAVYWKVFVDGETSASITLAAARDVQLGVVAYSNVNQAAPIDVSGSASKAVSTTDITAPSVTTTGPDRRIVRLYSERSSTATTATTPTGTTFRASSFGIGAPSTSLLIVDTKQESAGATGSALSTFSAASFNGVGLTVALTPATSVPSNVAWVAERGVGTLPTATNMTFVDGTLACKFDPSTVGSRYMLDNVGETHDYYFYRFYIYPLSSPGSSDTIFGYEQSGTTRASVKVNSDMTLSLTHGASVVATTTAALALNTWSRIELNVDSVNNVSQLEIYSWPNFNSTQPTERIERTDYTEAGALGEVIMGFSGLATWSYLVDAIQGDDQYRPGPVVLPVPPPPEIVVPPSASWNLVSGPATGGYDVPIVRAYAREFTFRLNEPTQVKFNVKGRSLEAGSLEELTTDVHAIREGVILSRGRVGATSDVLDISDHSVTINAIDYKGLLGRRTLHSTDTLTYTSQDTADIAWALITDTQNNVSGDLGITRGLVVSTGNIMSTTYEVGTSIYTEIQNLAQQNTGGFDWDLVPVNANQQEFRMYPVTPGSPGTPATHGRGSDKGVVLEYGGAIKAVQRDVDPGTYANAGRFTGGSDTLTAVNYTAAGGELEGLFDANEGFSEIQDQSMLNARAAYRIAQLRTVIPSYTLTLVNGFWLGPEHIWLGDTVQVVINSGRLAVDTPSRVMEIKVSLTDEGEEQVVLQCGAISLGLPEEFRRAYGRLKELERR